MTRYIFIRVYFAPFLFIWKENRSGRVPSLDDGDIVERLFGCLKHTCEGLGLFTYSWRRGLPLLLAWEILDLRRYSIQAQDSNWNMKMLLSANFPNFSYFVILRCKVAQPRCSSLYILAGVSRKEHAKVKCTHLSNNTSRVEAFFHALHGSRKNRTKHVQHRERKRTHC